MSAPRREVEFLAEVTRSLIQASRDGAAGGGKELAERLRALARGCQALKFKRLYWILEALAARLARPDPDIDPSALEELGRLLADARYTCKAIKSHLTTGLSDVRLVEDLIGSGWGGGEVETLRDRGMILVGEMLSREGGEMYRTSFLLDPMVGRTYAHREHRPLVDGALQAPFTELGPCPLVVAGTVLPTFEPTRLRIDSVAPGTMNETALAEFLDSRTPDAVGGLLERFRTQREEYLAPRTLPVFFRPAALDPTPPGGLVDRHGNVLPLLREPGTFALCDHLVRALEDPPGAGYAVFGRLVFAKNRFSFVPWSVIFPSREPPVQLL